MFKKFKKTTKNQKPSNYAFCLRQQKEEKRSHSAVLQFPHTFPWTACQDGEVIFCQEGHKSKAILMICQKYFI